MIDKGVCFVDSSTVYLKEDTQIASGVVVEPFVVFGSKVTIEEGCVVKAFSHIEDAVVEKNCIIGPFARIRGSSVIKENGGIGNFVEVARSVVGKNSPAWHLSFIGDSEIGENVEIGGGLVTCNYDGLNKNKTKIEDNCFVGSNVTLIAPVKLGEDSLIAAGSVISGEVEKDALAISRSPLILKANGSSKYKQKLKSKIRLRNNAKNKRI